MKWNGVVVSKLNQPTQSWLLSLIKPFLGTFCLLFNLQVSYPQDRSASSSSPVQLFERMEQGEVRTSCDDIKNKRDFIIICEEEQYHHHQQQQQYKLWSSRKEISCGFLSLISPTAAVAGSNSWGLCSPGTFTQSGNSKKEVEGRLAQSWSSLL